jgi:hypothetical protein
MNPIGTILVRLMGPTLMRAPRIEEGANGGTLGRRRRRCSPSSRCMVGWWSFETEHSRLHADEGYDTYL